MFSLHLPNTVLAWSLFKLCKPEIYILITSLILYQHNALTKIEIIYYTPKDICLSCTIRRQIAVDGDHVHRPKQFIVYRISSNRSRVSNTSRVSNRSRGSKGEYIELITHHPVATVVHCVIRAYCMISRTAVYGVQRKSEVLIEAGSLIEAGGSDTIVLIEAGGFY